MKSFLPRHSRTARRGRRNYCPVAAVEPWKARDVREDGKVPSGKLGFNFKCQKKLSKQKHNFVCIVDLFFEFVTFVIFTRE